MRALDIRRDADISILDTRCSILDAEQNGVRYGKVSGVRKNVQGARYKAQGSRIKI
jgi:hypothetical protein